MKNYLSTKLGKATLAVFLLLLVFWMVLKLRGNIGVWPLLEPLLLALILTAVLWVAIDLGFKAWERRRQASFDARLAAREGIEDRKREWAEWTTELRRQGIDRYQLPMYLLVGEPQSGKSILLRNSDLHFPFGQNRLSGVGGTKGCDWWFTDQAVILDLAGRLFTHEGGASDEAEWSAFLELLSDFRPQCPANGVILVLPCDGLASESEAVVAKKAAKMQSALLTLTDKLQARLPVYVVLTKADKVFGFAECVHRLDAPKRHEMFGWSRPLERLESPFDFAEAQTGFQGVVERARLLRSQMLATARLPEALSEVDRFYAFPEELSALWPMLALYLQRVFTESSLIDKLFFRGFYLTSGLQSGAPIVKVCAELLGTTGEADRRNLEGLFTKHRAYFIKDLVRERIFTEQGLVRPTKQRVIRARRNAVIAYGCAGIGALASLCWTTVVLANESSEKTLTEGGRIIQVLEDARGKDIRERLAATTELREFLGTRSEILSPNVKGACEALLENKVEHDLLPELGGLVADAFSTQRDPVNYEACKAQLELAQALLSERCDEAAWIRIRALLLDTMSLDFGVVSEGESNYSLHLTGENRDRVLKEADQFWDGVLYGGKGWAQPGPLGVVLACDELTKHGRVQPTPTKQDGCQAIRSYANALHLLSQSLELKAVEEPGGMPFVRRSSASDQLEAIAKAHADFESAVGSPRSPWARLADVRTRLAESDRVNVEKSLIELLKSEPLKAVCQPSFLVLDLQHLVRDLANRPSTGESRAVELFDAKCHCAGQDYEGKFRTLDELRKELSSKELSGRFESTLSEHLGGMVKALATLDESTWSSHIERLIDEYEEGLLSDWKSDPRGLDVDLPRHLESIGRSVKTSGREAWDGGVVLLLAERLGERVPEAAVTFGRRLGELRELQGTEYARSLSSAVRALGARESGSAWETSERLFTAKTQAGAPPLGGAGDYAMFLFEALRERVFQLAVRPDFLRELEGLIGSKGTFNGLVKMLWNRPAGSADLGFFDRDDGDLDRLLAKYWLAPAPSPVAGAPAVSVRDGWSLAEFSGPEHAEQPWESVRFLLDLQAFLLSGAPNGDSVKSSKIMFGVQGKPESPAFAAGKLQFHVLGGAKPESTFIDSNMGALRIEWSFGSAKSLRMRMSDVDRAAVDANDFVIEEPGPLAPLVLAWEGSETSKRDWVLIKKPKGTELEAELTFQFEPHLPARPQTEPFSP